MFAQVVELHQRFSNAQASLGLLVKENFHLLCREQALGGGDSSKVSVGVALLVVETVICGVIGLAGQAFGVVILEEDVAAVLSIAAGGAGLPRGTAARNCDASPIASWQRLVRRTALLWRMPW